MLSQECCELYENQPPFNFKDHCIPARIHYDFVCDLSMAPLVSHKQTRAVTKTLQNTSASSFTETSILYTDGNMGGYMDILSRQTCGVGLSSSCSNVNFLTPQTSNPYPTKPSGQPQKYQMDRMNPRETKCTQTLT